MDFILLKCSGCAAMLPNKKNHRSETPLHLAASVHNKGKDMSYQVEIDRIKTINKKGYNVSYYSCLEIFRK